MWNSLDKSSQLPIGYMFLLPWELKHIGGVNVVVRNLFRELEKSGAVRPFVMVNDWEYKKPQSKIVDGRTTLFLRLRDPVFQLRPMISYALNLPFDLYRLLCMLKRYNVKVINPHFPSLGNISFVILKKLRLYRGKIVLSFHGSDLEKIKRSDSWLEKIAWSYIASNSNIIIAVSNDMKTTIDQLWPHARSVIIANGIDPGVLNTLPNKARINNTITKIICVGNFVQIKGQDILLKAAMELKKSYSITLTLVGREGETLEKLRSTTVENGLADITTFKTNLENLEVLNLLQNSDIFVLPSRRESFGISIIEAGIVETPVIATNTGGIPEIITNNENGLLFKVDDYKHLERLLKILINEPSERKRMSKNLKKKVLNNYTWNTAASQYLKYTLYSRMEGVNNS